MKKILVDGEKIQNEKGNVEKENQKWNNGVLKALKKYNLSISGEWLVKINNLYEIRNYDEVMEKIASKNLPMVYANESNHITLINDYDYTIEIIKELKKEEVEKILDVLINNYQDYTFNQLVQLNILKG